MMIFPSVDSLLFLLSPHSLAAPPPRRSPPVHSRPSRALGRRWLSVRACRRRHHHRRADSHRRRCLRRAHLAAGLSGADDGRHDPRLPPHPGRSTARTTHLRCAACGGERWHRGRNSACEVSRTLDSHAFCMYLVVLFSSTRSRGYHEPRCRSRCSSRCGRRPRSNFSEERRRHAAWRRDWEAPSDG